VNFARIHPARDANEVTAEQVEAFLGRSLAEKGLAPVFDFDAGYEPVKLQQGPAESKCPYQILLRAKRSFYGDASLSEPPGNMGRPRRHGPKIKCSDPSTWPEPSADYACEDDGYGAVRVRAWAGLHPKVSAHEGRGAGAPCRLWWGC
jgi:hypothetical protein